MPKPNLKQKVEHAEKFNKFADILDSLLDIHPTKRIAEAALGSLNGLSKIAAWSTDEIAEKIQSHLDKETSSKDKSKLNLNRNTGIQKYLLDLAAYLWILHRDHVRRHIVFDTMKQEIQWQEDTGALRDWIEEDDYDILISIQNDNINATDKHVKLAVNRIAKKNSIDPVLNWLKALEWDGVERLDTLLPKYFSGNDSHYSRSIGRMFMISAVARQFEPGCQVDHMLILEGQQGLYKTRGLEALFGQKYLNDNLSSISGKEASIEVRGFMAVNIDEMGAFKGSKLANLKSFITKREETYVRKFENRTTKEPRRCVFVGTTNETHYLFDDDNRRYWPFEVEGKIDKDLIVKDRDQIWAEAVHLYTQGVEWWPSDELTLALKAEQIKRQPHDPLVDQLHQFVWFYEKITINEICEKLYGRQSTADKGKASIIGRKLSKLGFTSSRHHGSLQYWHRPKPIPDDYQLIIATMLDHERSRFVEKMYEYSSTFRPPPDRSNLDEELYEIYHAKKDFIRQQSPLYDEAKYLIAKHYERFETRPEDSRFMNEYLDKAYFHIIHNLFPVPIMGDRSLEWGDENVKLNEGVEYELGGSNIKLGVGDLAELLGRSPKDPLLIDEPKTLEAAHMAFIERDEAIELDKKARLDAHQETYSDIYKQRRKAFEQEKSSQRSRLVELKKKEMHEPILRGLKLRPHHAPEKDYSEFEKDIPDFFKDLSATTTDDLSDEDTIS